MPLKPLDYFKNIVLTDHVDGNISPVEFEQFSNLDNKLQRNLHTYKSKKHFLPEIETNEMKSLYKDDGSPSSATLKMNKISTLMSTSRITLPDFEKQRAGTLQSSQINIKVKSSIRNIKNISLNKN